VGDTLTLAVAAGMLAAVNPCGFALLPAYLSVLVLGDDAPGPVRSVGRALWLTAWMTVGFVAVFGVFGLVVSPVAAHAQQYLPWFTTAFGALVALAGLWLLAGRELPRLQLSQSASSGRPLTRSVPTMVGFGMSYAAASLTCSIAPFLAIVVTSFRSGPAAEGVGLFVAYSVGMGLLVGVAAVAVALARRGLVTGLRRTGRWIPRASGLLLVVVGAYVAWYGAWELRVLGGADTADPVIELAARVQRTLAGWVRALAP
jgi:cytochrome c-type biogenesis protein